MTPLRNVTIAIAMLIASTTTVADGFAPAIPVRRAKTSLHAARRTSSSPLLDEALSTYPFQFRPDGEKTSGTKASCSAVFNELARLYGDEEALAMVQLVPQSLRFKKENFAPCLEAWEEQFGLEAAQGMVRRNPGLLGVPPSLAKEPAESSMAMSYVVAFTRPLPKLIAAGGLLAIMTAGMR